MKIYRISLWLTIVGLLTSSCRELQSSEIDSAKSSAVCNKIAFVLMNEEGSDLYAICPDGSHLTQITNDAAGNIMPAWSPDGTKLAYAALEEDSSQIYIIDEDGKHPLQLTFQDSNNFPIWLPDGAHIAFRSTDSKGLWWWQIINLENSQIVQWSEPSYDFFFQTPAWSPDGQKMAYMSLAEQHLRNDGSSQIHIKNLDGSDDIALTRDIWANVNPIWSPDGKNIAFLSERDGNYYKFALYIVSGDGMLLKKVSKPDFSENNTLTWSPDGKEIAISDAELPGNIDIINIQTGKSRKLLSLQAGEGASFPTWQRKDAASDQ
jgi:TolB protein